MTGKPPGLIKREIISSDGEMVRVRETWDPRVKGCPLLVFNRYTWPLQILNDTVESVTHTFDVPRSSVPAGELYEATLRDTSKG